MLRILSNISGELILADERSKAMEKTLKDKEEEELLYIYGTRYPNKWMKEHKEAYLRGKFYGFLSDSSFDYYDYSSYYDEPKSTDYCTIYFYEYSSVNNNQHRFYSKKEFLDFCNDCNIVLSDDDKKIIDKLSTAYISCIPGKSELMFTSSYYNLENGLNKFNKILSENA